MACDRRPSATRGLSTSAPTHRSTPSCASAKVCLRRAAATGKHTRNPSWTKRALECLGYILTDCAVIPVAWRARARRTFDRATCGRYTTRYTSSGILSYTMYYFALWREAVASNATDFIRAHCASRSPTAHDRRRDLKRRSGNAAASPRTAAHRRPRS